MSVASYWMKKENAIYRGGFKNLSFSCVLKPFVRLNMTRPVPVLEYSKNVRTPLKIPNRRLYFVNFANKGLKKGGKE